ncbi:MAG: Serine protease, DegP/HtrA, do-like [Firmicutes bacterium]|nr:Serine protease, DegP/HtrA, do-like [Bacillota bacterium]MDI6704930.1 trypsin-like peptidase domain-containing protein [Bacillota bacterium]
MDNNEFLNSNLDNSQAYKHHRRPPGPFRGFFYALVGAIIGGLLVSLLLPQMIENKLISLPNGQQNIVIEPRTEDLTVIPAVAQKAAPTVVGVTTVTIQRDMFFGILREGQGVGSGIIVHSDGYILTNDHVVNSGKAEKINVLFSDGTEKPAKVLWTNNVLDLAVLKVDAKNLPTADLGDSDELAVGEMAIAIGNPLGLDFQRSVTSGIISGLHRSIQISNNVTMENLIQTDASINPGNSGGPLLNSRGEVIGINSAKVSSSEAEGLGFAIPINQAKPIVEQIIEKGKFTMVYLGITGVDVETIKQQYNTELSVDEGVYVFKVEKGSPGEAAGLGNGDIITELNGKKISGMSQLIRELYKYKPGDVVKVKISRGDAFKEVDVKLEARPENLQ